MNHGTAKHWSRGRLEAVPECPVCGNTRRKGREVQCRDFRGEVPDLWQIHRCVDCHSLYLDPRPDAESLPRAYDQYYTHDKEDDQGPQSGLGAFLWRMIYGYLNHTFSMNRQPSSTLGAGAFKMLPPLRLKLDYYGRHLYPSEFPAQGQLLDLGCGNGSFLVRAREMGWSAIGLEPDPKAAEAARQEGLDVYQGMLADAPANWKEKFDVITMSHVIEHLPAPADALKTIFDFLKPGGVLWLACPNPDSLGSRFYRSAWRGLHAPFHLAIPTQAALRHLLDQAGFRPIRLLRRGTHAKVIIAESARTAQGFEGAVWQFKSACAPLIRLLSDAAGTLKLPLAEETVIRAQRPR